jgi:hypothetical protein
MSHRNIFSIYKLVSLVFICCKDLARAIITGLNPFPVAISRKELPRLIDGKIISFQAVYGSNNKAS